MSKTIDIDPEVTSLKDAAIAYFDEGGWDKKDLIKIKRCKAIWELSDVIYNHFATYVGRRKGWGDEGIGELSEEFKEDIAKAAGMPEAFDGVF